MHNLLCKWTHKVYSYRLKIYCKQLYVYSYITCCKMHGQSSYKSYTHVNSSHAFVLLYVAFILSGSIALLLMNGHISSCFCYMAKENVM